ncbi:MAG: ABC transporter substrate-binding protein [Rhodocyclaceae bacterium]|jgi:ABC-type Fe3+-hydroxamate transport system substrate-binding protein|nr:ABC transporter substrate-binding protein [Rhodocyclaceae bacterium]
MSVSSELRDALGTQHAPTQAEPRIVSLVPSLTELLCDLGLAGNLVGRSGFCIHPRATVTRIPKMGGTKDADIERIRAAAPTHLVVNIDENRREQVDALAQFVPHVVVTHPNAPEDNLALFRLFGGIFRREAEAQRLAADFRAAREALRRATQDLPRSRVLYLIWKDPWMSVARDTYISAMLAAAGWDTLPERSEARYPVVDAVPGRPIFAERVLLSTEPYRFAERHLAEAAARFGAPAQLVDGEMLSWYGSRAAAGLRYLARLRQDEASSARSRG